MREKTEFSRQATACTARTESRRQFYPMGGYGIMVAVRQIGNFSESKRSNPNTNRVYDKSGLSPTLNTMQGGNRQPMVVDEVVMNEREYKSDDDEQRTRYRIRKLTCREVWRLMGFSDSDFEKAAEVNSNTQLYKEAGNSIVKDVLMAIFRQMNIRGVEPWNK